MAELADAQASGACALRGVEVRLLSSALGLPGHLSAVQVLEFEEETVLPGDAVRGGQTEVLFDGFEFGQQTEIEQIGACQ